MNEILVFDKLSFSYPGRPRSLNEVSFAVERGKKVAVVGPNGAGKTTLLLMCNGTLSPESGSVLIDGKEIDYSKSGLREVRCKVGLVFQNSDSQIFAPSVYADVAFGPANLHLSDEEISSRVHDAVFAVGLSGFEKRAPHHLSGGEKKRVAIAGILAMKPEILVADEPTASLDPATAAEIMDLLNELHEDGTTILLSTHDVELAYSWADEVVLLSAGKILKQSTPAEVFTDYNLMKEARLTPPVLLNLYMELVRRKVITTTTPPKGIPEMSSLIKSNLNIDAGTIYTADTDVLDSESLKAILSKHSDCHIGLMGTRSKKFCHEEDITPEYTYGVTDKALLSANIGENTLILTSGNMIERVEMRVKIFENQTGISINVVRL